MTAAERRDLATRYADLVADFASLGGSGRRRPIPSFLTQRKHLRRRAELAHRFRDIAASLERLGVGAEPRHWGVLSVAPRHGIPRFSLEQTCKGLLVTADRDKSLALERVAKRLPHARAQAEFGERQPVEAIEADLAQLVEATPHADPLHRDLVLHLTPERRPLPGSPEALCRTGSPLLLQVSRQDGMDDEPRLFLHDIVVDLELRGAGLGTAALGEVCRYADHLGLPIEGDLTPDAGQDSFALARWYHAAGFRLGDLQPSSWRPGERMRRNPQSAPPTV